MGIERICAYCKSKEPSDRYKGKSVHIYKAEIDLYNIDKFVFYDKKTYHKECFYKLIIGKRKKLTDIEIELILCESKSHIKQAIISEKLFRFMLENYNLTVIHNRVFQKLSSIYSGTYRGMSVGIPIDDLFDMWQRKIRLLNKIANQNITKGKEIDGNDRILYDLSVLINKYDSYLQWKREQEILQLSTNTSKQFEVNKINIDLIEKQAKSQQNDIFVNDINTLLDEIF